MIVGLADDGLTMCYKHYIYWNSFMCSRFSDGNHLVVIILLHLVTSCWVSFVAAWIRRGGNENDLCAKHDHIYCCKNSPEIGHYSFTPVGPFRT